jgi:hypothetical protein
VPIGDTGFRVLDAVVGAGLLSVLGCATASLVVRYRN